MRACRGMPITWGGQNGLDDHIMARRNERRIQRGLEPWQRLRCVDLNGESTENEFWGRRPGSSSESANVAATLSDSAQ